MESGRNESPHQTRARAAKAAAVVELLVLMYRAPEALEHVLQATEDDWGRWARMASVRPLSARSRELVQIQLGERVHPSNADPFVGL